MSAQEQQQTSQAGTVQEVRKRTEARPIAEVAKGLEAFEGYTLFEEAIPESKGLNPARPARRDIFKKDAAKAEERALLAVKADLWQRVLKGEQTNTNTH
jgi:hypothetical protein